MRHPWGDDDYPAPLLGRRSTQDAPSRIETVLMALLLLGLLLAAGLTEVQL